MQHASNLVAAHEFSCSVQMNGRGNCLPDGVRPLIPGPGAAKPMVDQPGDLFLLAIAQKIVWTHLQGGPRDRFSAQQARESIRASAPGHRLSRRSALYVLKF